MLSRALCLATLLCALCFAEEASGGTCPEGHMKAFRLRSRPEGDIADTDLELVTEPLPEVGPEQVLVRNLYISVDPTHRIWMSDKAQYMPKVEIGEVMRAITVGEVIVSNHEGFPVGVKVMGMGGVGTHYIGIPGVTLYYECDKTGLPLTADLSVASVVIGLTAWHGVVKILAPKEGDIVVVSGGAGAVGSIAGQLAKARGATVVGIAGSEEKCNWMTGELGFDKAVNYKTDDVQQTLKDFAPEGITHYFDNVGGAVTDAVLMNAKNYAKVALCGSISEYNDNWSGQKNFNMILMRRITITGFICTDHMDELQDAVTEIATLVQDGVLHYKEDVRDGLENYIEVVRLLYNGGNTGKLMIKV